ncbi:flavin reductase family protein [Poseidonocella sp. HB161398]|uniref:flavin reductase family protein n=1 Tax=Poseidonocella sp. HB161398 TaxID=2320855 RepID=UPI001107F3E9|nr:flavin reductase family protein [Poseidonocella sp. HB161398]
MDFRDFDMAALAPAETYKLLSGAILPRPIALVTTCSAEGAANAAPFSFFGVLGHDPATVALGIEKRPDGRRKDTARNILETGAFILHIPDVALAAAVERMAAPEAPGVDEIALAGLETRPGRHVACPRIAAAPVALECRFVSQVDLGTARDILLGEVLGISIRADAVDDRHRVDAGRIDALARLGGPHFATVRDRFTL